MLLNNLKQTANAHKARLLLVLFFMVKMTNHSLTSPSYKYTPIIGIFIGKNYFQIIKERIIIKEILHSLEILIFNSYKTISSTDKTFFSIEFF